MCLFSSLVGPEFNSDLATLESQSAESSDGLHLQPISKRNPTSNGVHPSSHGLQPPLAMESRMFLPLGNSSVHQHPSEFRSLRKMKKTKRTLNSLWFGPDKGSDNSQVLLESSLDEYENFLFSGPTGDHNQSISKPQLLLAFAHLLMSSWKICVNIVSIAGHHGGSSPKQYTSSLPNLHCLHVPLSQRSGQFSPETHPEKPGVKHAKRQDMRHLIQRYISQLIQFKQKSKEATHPHRFQLVLFVGLFDVSVQCHPS